MSETIDKKPNTLTNDSGFHGGDIWKASRNLKIHPNEILDLSASLNPLGPPAGLWDHLKNSFGLICHYPDRNNYGLRKTLSEHLNIKPDNLLLGNGSTALIRLAARALDLKNILVLAPCFGEFPRSLALAGRHFHFLPIPESQNFAPNMADLDRIWQESPSCVVVTNPVSPSGVLLKQDFLEALLSQAEQRKVWVVLDEAFIDFAPKEKTMWSPPKLLKHDRLLILRSMTKFFCLAGLRLGYMMANENTIAHLEPLGEPWSVNTLAHEAGIFCLGQEEYAAQTRSVINKWRELLVKNLKETELFVYPSEVNYVLTCLPFNGPNAEKVAERLAEHGILVRDCKSFSGCTEYHLRFAVATPEEQKRLFEYLPLAMKP